MCCATCSTLDLKEQTMDEIVRAAMEKWPNVPDLYGWLALDGRGRFLLQGARVGNPAM